MFAPFQGLLFDSGRVPAVGEATSPPYDVIDAAEREALAAAHPHNVVRLLLPEGGEARYQRAAEHLSAWQDAGILVRDDEPRFYVYEIEYGAEDGATQVARGVIGELVVTQLGERVQPHEETMPKTRSDRLSLLRATRANLDPITVLSAAPELAAAAAPTGPPRLEFAAGEATHRLYDLADPAAVAAVEGAVASQPVVIADGHHRYVTSLAYQAEQGRDGPWDRIMAFVAPAVGSGLRIASAHRFFAELPGRLEGLNGSFRAEAAAAEPPERPGELVVVPGSRLGTGPVRLVATDDALARLPRAFRRASAAVARDLLYPLLDVGEDDAIYDPDPAHVIARLADAPGGVAVLTAPVDEQAVADAIAEGVVFPQKTTYFVPKPRAGLVIRAW